jgi:hypothetical protein
MTMAGKANKPTVSLDRLTITANLSADDFNRWERDNRHLFVDAKVAKTRWGYPLYRTAYLTPDGTHVSLDKKEKLGSPHQIRLQFNPNREPLFDDDPGDITIRLLTCLKDVRITGIDIAIDYLGVRAHEFEFLYPRVQRKTVATGFGCQESIEFGAPSSSLKVAAYAKDKQRAKQNQRILTVNGEMFIPEDDEPWMRIEASMKNDSILREDAFRGLTIFRKGAFVPPSGMSRAMAERLTVIAINPAYMDYPTVHQNTRDDWRKKLLKGVDMLEPHPQKVYEDEYEQIKEAIDYLLSPVGNGLSPQAKNLLNV